MRILTFALCLLCFSVSAQNNSINVYPWNPDSDQDNLIGVQDLQSLLTVYGNSFGLPPEPCTYDGTDIEDWWSLVMTGDVIVDSVFFELLLVDSAVVFYPGCPDPQMEIVEFAWAGKSIPTLTTSPYGLPSLQCVDTQNRIHWHFQYNGGSGRYNIATIFPYLTVLGFSGDGFFGGQSSYWRQSAGYGLPFPDETYSMDQSGIHVNNGTWGTGSWPYYANYLHILPYWHYADE